LYLFLKNLNMKKMGLDWGEKRIGIAISDELLFFAHPLEIIENSSKTKSILKNIIQKENIDEVVVGLPITLRGEMGKQAIKTKEQVEETFKDMADIKIKLKFWDERMSTRHANRLLKEVGLRIKDRRKIKKLDDKIAASLILQGYLNYLKRENEEI